jgi:hypothetical protein
MLTLRACRRHIVQYLMNVIDAPYADPGLSRSVMGILANACRQPLALVRLCEESGLGAWLLGQLFTSRDHTAAKLALAAVETLCAGKTTGDRRVSTVTEGWGMMLATALSGLAQHVVAGESCLLMKVALMMCRWSECPAWLQTSLAQGISHACVAVIQHASGRGGEHATGLWSVWLSGKNAQSRKVVVELYAEARLLEMGITADECGGARSEDEEFVVSAAAFLLDALSGARDSGALVGTARSVLKLGERMNGLKGSSVLEMMQRVVGE